MTTATERDKVRLSLDVSPELNQLLDSLATRTHDSKSDVLRKAIVLMDVAVKASQEGNRLLVEEPAKQRLQRPKQTEIIGLFPPIASPIERLDAPDAVGRKEVTEDNARTTSRQLQRSQLGVLGRATIGANPVPLHAAPSMNAAIHDNLLPGTVVDIDSLMEFINGPIWYRVSVPYGDIGWIREEFLTDISELPIADTIVESSQ